MALYLKIYTQLNQLIKHYPKQLAADRDDSFRVTFLSIYIYREKKKEILQ